MNNLPARKIMYKALLEKDTKFEGVFYAAIKTTGIFCRPSCTARKPKEENVEYFESVKSALDNGYRPCKVCSPLIQSGETPDWVKKLLKDVSKNPEKKIRDWELRKMGIEPAKLRRWFKKNYGITFQAYLRSSRINSAYGRLKLGEKITESAFASGYDSLSGFTEQFRKSVGFNPSEAKSKVIINIIRLTSPLGPLLAGANENGICLLEFTDRKMLETQLKRVRNIFNAELITGDNKHFNQLDKELKEYFEGKRKKFDVPLQFQGTDFQMKVWKELMNIPFGITRSYKEQAINLGKPEAVRAVARANGDNRISIIIPCHRVIGSDGSLTGYGGGLPRKEWLLNHETKFK